MRIPAAEFVIHPVEAHEVDAVLEFYDARPDHHLWPRGRDDLTSYADEGELWVLRDDRAADLDAEAISGACYLRTTGDPDGLEQEREFGGILLDKTSLGKGVADIFTHAVLAIAIAAASKRYVPVIAHVHEANLAPRKLLESKLKFLRNPGRDGPVPTAAKPPSTMRRNGEGEVVGHLFELPRTSLAHLAAWVRRPLDSRFRCDRLSRWSDDIATTLEVLAQGDP